jgi:purine-binding chemotaxis protein CheW
MNRLNRLVVFNLDDHKVALSLSVIRRIIRAVEITSLPKAPEIVLGIINMHGRIIPVFDMRSRFLLPTRNVQLSDQMIIADTAKRRVALLVDSADDVIEVPEERIITGEHILPGLEYVEGVVKTEDGMIIIHDIESFLSLQEEKVLDEAMEALNSDERQEG